jgi:hypothetical protein
MQVSLVDGGALGEIPFCKRRVQCSPDGHDILVDEEMRVVSRVDGASFLASNADAEHNPGSQLLVEREVFARTSGWRRVERRRL